MFWYKQWLKRFKMYPKVELNEAIVYFFLEIVNDHKWHLDLKDTHDTYGNVCSFKANSWSSFWFWHFMIRYKATFYRPSFQSNVKLPKFWQHYSCQNLFSNHLFVPFCATKKNRFTHWPLLSVAVLLSGQGLPWRFGIPFIAPACCRCGLTVWCWD